jgi:hypothetical protein
LIPSISRKKKKVKGGKEGRKRRKEGGKKEGRKEGR